MPAQEQSYMGKGTLWIFCHHYDSVSNRKSLCPNILFVLPNHAALLDSISVQKCSAAEVFFKNCSPGFPSQYTEGGAATRVSGGAKSVGEDAGKHAERCSLCDRAEEEDRRLGQRGGQEGKLCKDAGVSTLSLFLLPTTYEPSRFVGSTGEIWAAFFHILSPSCLELLSNSQMHSSDTFSSFKNNSLWNNPPIKKNFRYVRIFQMFFLPCK